MVILGSQVKLAGTQQYREENIRQEKVQIQRTHPEKRSTERGILPSTAGRKSAKVSGSRKEGGNGLVWKVSEKDRQKLLILMKILKLLTGKDFRLCLPQESKLSDPVEITAEDHSSSFSDLGWAISVEVQEIYYESEKMSFSAQGTVHTADGGVSSFMVKVQLEREYYQKTSLTFQAGNAQVADPLVVNYRNEVTNLTGQTFQFALQGNSLLQNLPYLSRGSGYLALDRNGDGIINNGNELFGPATGDGFAELAAYDKDRNGWIDEGDEIFDQLKIWIKEAGNDEQGSLLSLRQVGIGALLVEGLKIGFSYKDAENKSLAQNRSTGIFLREDGTPGTIQQLDIVV